MQQIIRGIHHFQSHIFSSQRALFERLARGQRPDALFITCSNSRINPNLVTQTQPGELFMLRNAGNIVPPYGTNNGGEAATVEFAVVGLGISDIIVCGHSHCGAMKGLLDPEAIKHMPTMASWLTHAEATRLIARQQYTDLAPDALMNVTIQENVLVQLESGVDAADYVVWRKSPNLYGDTEGYHVWLAMFSRTTGGGSPASSAAVPEPSAWLLVFGTVCCCRRTRAPNV